MSQLNDNVIRQIHGQGNIQVSQIGESAVISPAERGDFAGAMSQCAIFDHQGSGFYSWQQQVWDETNQKWVSGIHSSATSGNIYELNAVERAPAGHVYPAWPVEQGRWVFFSGLGRFDGTQATELGDISEDETPFTDTASVGGDTFGFIIHNVARMSYKHNSNEILYAFYREMDFDALGNLIHVTKETRVIIDEPVACDLSDFV